MRSLTHPHFNFYLLVAPWDCPVFVLVLWLSLFMMLLALAVGAELVVALLALMLVHVALLCC